ncbi:MAG: biotin/lipoyl-binding protein [Lachnospiraceae bacterium]|nr:biotin/lipoyl-binding protein [Lachnospiraceae bacterium]
MKNYTITVNGNTYDVVVEEGSGAAVSAPVSAPKAAAPKPAAPKAAPASAAGSVKVTAPMPGKILKVNVANGAAVKKGQAIIVLEAMKMENEIVAPQDGTIASVNVTVGQTVEAGDLLASLN